MIGSRCNKIRIIPISTIFQFLKPLTWDLWIAYFGLLLVFTLSQFLTSPNLKLKRFKQCLWHFLSLSLQLGPTQEVTGLWQGILTSAWTFFSLILLSTYVGVFVFLLNDIVPLPFQNHPIFLCNFNTPVLHYAY